jgi:glycosyltransferase involved in cell wall biosynthesis
VRFVLAGGKPDQVERARAQATAAGATGIIFAGEQPSESIPAFLDAADVLVSPRSSGTNTPLKIYQYLRSGRVIVATRLLTHTQVLSDDVAILTGATPEEFAHGILRAFENGAAAHLGAAAKRLAETRYTYEAYLQRTREACAALVA